MATKIINNCANPASTDDSNSSAFKNMRASFLEWLINGNAKKFSPQASVACLDRISEYIIKMERDTYKTFAVAIMKSA
ncbi:MAG: hypothetical protein LBC96_04895 [Lachnospiraceae bacterium]|nr:hypothetical protein [Lachnospiraceae bacterium]